MKRTYLFFVTLIMTVSIVFAYQGRPGLMHHGDPKFDNPKFYQYMVFRMTEYLELTPEQSENFFPIYNRHVKDERQIHKVRSLIAKESRERKKVSQSDVNGIRRQLDSLYAEQRKEKDRFYKEIDKILSPEQSLKYMFFEEKFRRELMEELKERQ